MEFVGNIIRNPKEKGTVTLENELHEFFYNEEDINVRRLTAYQIFSQLMCAF